MSSTILSSHSLSPSSALSAETWTTGMSSPGNSYSDEQLAHLELDELEQLGVVHHVGLVERDDDVRHADLAGQQDVLARLRHGAVGRGDDEDRAVHLRGTRDHVLDVVGMPGAVDVRVVALVGLVLDVRGGDGDAALALFRSLVDRREIAVLVGATETIAQDLGDRRGQRRLSMVDVTDRADVEMRLSPLELLLGHVGPKLPFPWTRVTTWYQPRSRPQGSWGLRRSCGIAWSRWRGPASSIASKWRTRTSRRAERVR